MRHSPCGAFDLHVLSLPPAFVLSQDQTLKLTGISAAGRNQQQTPSRADRSKLGTRPKPDPLDQPKPVPTHLSDHQISQPGHPDKLLQVIRDTSNVGFASLFRVSQAAAHVSLPSLLTMSKNKRPKLRNPKRFRSRTSPSAGGPSSNQIRTGVQHLF